MAARRNQRRPRWIRPAAARTCTPATAADRKPARLAVEQLRSADADNQARQPGPEKGGPMEAPDCAPCSNHSRTPTVRIRSRR